MPPKKGPRNASRRKSTGSASPRPAKSKPKAKANANARKRAKTVPTAAVLQHAPPQITGPLPTIVLDTGGWSVKHATLYPEKNLQQNQIVKPTHSPNVSAKPKHQLATLLSSQIESVQNKSQLITTRPLERGYIVDLGTQFQIWDYILQLENLEVRHSFSNGGVSGVMPSVALQKTRKTNPTLTAGSDGSNMTFTHTAAVFCLVQPFTPRCILEREDEVWFRDFGFGKVARKLGACCSAFKYLRDGKCAAKVEEGNSNSTYATRNGIEDDETGCCCVIDCGFSMTSIVPTVYATALVKGIRRINIGGKLLTNLLKQTVSYRKFNLMDEFFIVNEAKEALCFLSMNYNAEMKNARETREGSRWFDREFVLPDFVNTFKGSVRLPAMLQRLNDIEEKENAQISGEDDENVASNGNQGIDEKETQSLEDATNDENNGDISDEETEDQARRRILKQRDEERRRQELEDQERQALPLSVERFAIPEILFRPSDIGIEQLGVAEAIVQSIEACDPMYRAALYQNILLTGGSAKIPYFRQRLEVDLRRLVDSKYNIRVYLPENPDDYAWSGAAEYAVEKKLMNSLYLERVDWESKREAGDVIWKESQLGCDL
jgi:actin-related protein